MSKIVKMSKSRAELLTRMKSTYVDTGIRGVSDATILVPDRRASFFDRVGKHFVVRNNLTPSEVFSEEFSIYPIPAENFTDGTPNYEKAIKNQNEALVDKVSDNYYLIEADFGDLEKYVSTNLSQPGEHYWLGLVIDTGEATIIGSKFNGYAFTEDDVAEADFYRAPKGSFIFWVKLDEYLNRTFILERDSKETGINIRVKNTAIEDVVAPFLVSAVANFEQGSPINFIGKNVTVEQNSTLTSVEAILNSSVILNGAPKVVILIDEVEHDYGTITVDSENNKKVIVTPIGSNGVSALLGEFVLKFPADSIRHKAVGNAETLINLTVEEAVTPTIESAFLHVSEGDPIEFENSVITVNKDVTVDFIEFGLNTFVKLNGTPKLKIVVDEVETDFATIAVDALDVTKLIVTPIGDGILGTEGTFTLTLPADSVRHLGVGNVEREFTLVVQTLGE